MLSIIIWHSLAYGALTRLPGPPVMHICIGGCYTLDLRDGRYVYTDPQGSRQVYTIERFTKKEVILNRTDIRFDQSVSGIAVLKGKLSGREQH